jgi:hypothetical protein
MCIIYFYYIEKLEKTLLETVTVSIQDPLTLTRIKPVLLEVVQP